MLFLQALSNLVIAAAALVMAIAILPRLRVKRNVTIWAGILFFLLTAAQHIDILFAQLFSQDPYADDRRWYLLSLRAGAAIAITVFVAGIFIDVARWQKLEKTMGDTPEDDRD